MFHIFLLVNLGVALGKAVRCCCSGAVAGAGLGAQAGTARADNGTTPRGKMTAHGVVSDRSTALLLLATRA